MIALKYCSDSIPWKSHTFDVYFITPIRISIYTEENNHEQILKSHTKNIQSHTISCSHCVCYRGGGVLAPLQLANAATTYDLATDFSSTSNPNGVWSYTQDGTPITQGLSSPEASGWGYSYSGDGSILHWGSAIDGSAAHDLQPGDVTIHTLSHYDGWNLFAGVTWTSPTAGLYSISGRAWEADFESGRNANWTLTVGGVLVAENNAGVYGLFRNDTAAQFNSNLLPGMSLTSLNLTAGEQVTFLTQTSSYYGHFMGVDMTVTSVPIPAAIWLFGSALAGLAGFSRRKSF